ncbi:MAG: hypothetical protein IPJ65_39375 [Archangiaceae bacterium]|nr:hypothetical protein [Archangiaceae bacterium]
MRATALLSISLALGACGAAQNVELTGKLVMSRLPADWCGSGNPDTIRLDCAFDLGLWVSQVLDDGGIGQVTKTVCVKLEADPQRTWGTLPEALNQAMVKVDRIPQGRFRLEVAGIEPSNNGGCEHDASVAAASFYGKSEPIELMGTDVVKRIDIASKCLKAFTPTMTCIR